MIVDRHVYTNCGWQVGVFALHNYSFTIVSIVAGFSYSILNK